MRRRPRREVIDTKAQLSNAVMQYLGEYRRRKGMAPEDDVRTDHTDELFTWKRKDSESDKPVAAKQGTNVEPKLRVSNLLSKAAAEDASDSAVEGKDFKTDVNGYRNPARRSMRESVRSWQNFWKTPIAPSFVIGTIPAVGYYTFSKFTSPDDKESPEVRRIANELVAQDMANGVKLHDADHYLTLAVKKQRQMRWARAVAIALGSAAVAHIPNVNTSDWSSLYKYPEIPKEDKQPVGVRHNASMLGGHDPYKTADELRASILFDTRMSPEMKANALGVIDFAPKPYMSSTDVVKNAMSSGISARTGLPMGRIISSAAADAAVGYGLGALFGAGNPGRVAGLFGAGSALVNALQYAEDRY